MCVIVAKPAGVDIPDTKTLEQCFDSNPHGAGFMYAVNGNVNVTKGFLTFHEFDKELQKVSGRHNLTNAPMVFHFRIATHGAVNKANCHPFPVTVSYDKMSQLNYTCKLAVAHNGVIRSSEKLSDIRQYNVSDTMAFIAHMIAPVANAHGGAFGFLDTVEIPEMITSASGGKMAFLDGHGRLSFHGTFIEDHGVYYSNNSFKPVAYKPYTPTGYFSKGIDDYSEEAYIPVKYRYSQKKFEKKYLDNYEKAFLEGFDEGEDMLYSH